jgi:cytochrome c oxidase subunit 2
MIGRVVVMEPSHYAAWLEGGTGSGSGTESMVSKGEKLFNQFNCQSCHGGPSLTASTVPVPGAVTARAPALEGVYGKKVVLDTGRSVKADEGYLRESILNPAAKVVEGYEPLMPSYAGQVNEEQVLQLVAYLKSLGDTQKVEGGR